MNVLSDIIRPSGGLYYHARALINARRWRPFRDEIRLWLETWLCDRSKDLILIGPSAGYTLPSGWLKDFPRVIAYDLDPLAPALFRRKHKVNAEFHRANLFWSDGVLSLNPLKEILKQNPEANILFCNVLGQVLLEGSAGEDEWLGFLRRLRMSLRSRTWASYHDAMSTEKGRAVDHLTDGDWDSGLTRRIMTWQITSTKLHHVIGVHETAGPK